MRNHSKQMRNQVFKKIYYYYFYCIEKIFRLFIFVHSSAEINNEFIVQMTDKNEINANECSIKLFEEDNIKKLTNYNFSSSSNFLNFDKGIDCDE